MNISAYVKPFNITFTAYLDDLCFSSNTCFKKLVPVILTIIKQNISFLNTGKFIIVLIVAKLRAAGVW
jgi:hypothetical protein